MWELNELSSFHLIKWTSFIKVIFLSFSSFPQKSITMSFSSHNYQTTPHPLRLMSKKKKLMTKIWTFNLQITLLKYIDIIRASTFELCSSYHLPSLNMNRRYFKQVHKFSFILILTLNLTKKHCSSGCLWVSDPKP